MGGFGDPRACVHASAPKPRLICALIESPFWLICRKGETRIWVLGPPVSPFVRRRTSDRARRARRATGLSTGLVDSIQYDMESEQPAWVPELPGTRKHGSAFGQDRPQEGGHATLTSLAPSTLSLPTPPNTWTQPPAACSPVRLKQSIITADESAAGSPTAWSQVTPRPARHGA